MELNEKSRKRVANFEEDEEVLSTKLVNIRNLIEIENPYDSDATAAVNNFEKEEPSNLADLSNTTEPLSEENPDEDGHNNTENDDVFQTPDFYRCEAHIEQKTKREMEILKQKLKSEEVQLETANNEHKRSLLLLQAAQMEVDFQKRRLAQLYP